MATDYPPHTPWSQVPPDKWDPWDLVGFLGLEHLQPSHARELAPLIPRGEYRDDSSENLTSNIRREVIFPYMSRPPQEHQLWAVAQYFSLAYSADPRLHNVDPYLIADDTGLGKTTEVAMIIAYLVFIHDQCRLDPTFATPVMSSHKEYLLQGEFKEEIEVDDVNDGPIPSTRDYALEPFLIVTKKSVAQQMYDELAQILDPDRFWVCIFDAVEQKGDPENREKGHESLRFYTSQGLAPVIIMTWSGLAVEYKHTITDRDSRFVYKKFREYSIFDALWTLICFDEVGEVRQPKTQKAQHAFRLAAQAQAVLGLTATPVHKSPLDMLNIFRAMGYRKTQSTWSIREAAKSVERDRASLQKKIKAVRFDMASGDRVINLGDEWSRTFLPDTPDAVLIRKKWAQNEREMASEVMEPVFEMIKPHMIRRRHWARDSAGHPIVDLPTYVERVELVNLSKAERDALSAGLDDMQLPSGYSTGQRQDLIATSLGRKTVGPKIRRAVELVKRYFKADAHLPPQDQVKVLLYLHWVALVPTVLKHFAKAGITPGVVNGSVSEKERLETYEVFQTDGGPRVLLISDASTEGVNLHRASVLIFIDHPWTGAAREQTIGRIARIGQKRAVEIVDIIVDDSIDVWLRGMEEKQRRVAKGVDRHAHLMAPMLAAHVGKAVAKVETETDYSVLEDIKIEMAEINLDLRVGQELEVKMEVDAVDDDMFLLWLDNLATEEALATIENAVEWVPESLA